MAQKETVGIFIDAKADLKGFKQAETAAQKLTKTVKGLASAVGIAYGTSAVIDFGKASLKAFTQDQVAAVKLAKAVDNLGLSFANPAIDKFILNLEKSSGIVDETLRPAFQALLTTTGSVIQSQKLLNDALDISRGTGIDLATVSQDLANGYVGITKGLKKYNTGLTAAELKSKGFAAVLAILRKEYSGANAAYLTTYAGKFDLISVAVDNAKEKIGQGLVDAFTQLSGGGSVTAATQSINLFAEAVAALERGAGTAIGTLPTLFDKIKAAGKSFFFGFAGKQFNVPINVTPNPKDKPKTSAEIIKAALAKSEADAQKRANALAAATLKTNKALTAEQKKQADLKKAGTVFDMQQIELVAALKGKLSDDEKLRVEAQLALLNGNDAVAAKLTAQILQAQDSTGNLARLLTSLPDAKNPFQYLDGYLNGLAIKAAALSNATVSGSSAVTNIDPSSPSAVAPTPVAAGDFGLLASQGAGANGGFSSVVAAAMGLGSGSTVNITVQGSVISQQDLIAEIQNGTQLASLSGSPSQIGRIAGMFG
jgi:hypothetical protein